MKSFKKSNRRLTALTAALVLMMILLPAQASSGEVLYNAKITNLLGNLMKNY